MIIHLKYTVHWLWHSHCHVHHHDHSHCLNILITSEGSSALRDHPMPCFDRLFLHSWTVKRSLLRACPVWDAQPGGLPPQRCNLVSLQKGLALSSALPAPMQVQETPDSSTDPRQQLSQDVVIPGPYSVNRCNGPFKRQVHLLSISVPPQHVLLKRQAGLCVCLSLFPVPPPSSLPNPFFSINFTLKKGGLWQRQFLPFSVFCHVRL